MQGLKAPFLLEVKMKQQYEVHDVNNGGVTRVNAYDAEEAVDLVNGHTRLAKAVCTEPDFKVIELATNNTYKFIQV